jgi:hypothetical protein
MIVISLHATLPSFVSFSIFEGKDSEGNGLLARIKRKKKEKGEENKVMKICQICSKS